MTFTFKFPVYVFVESALKDSKGATTFTNPMTITCTSSSGKPTIIAIPVFTTEAKAVAFRQATTPPNSRWLKLPTPDSLADFLAKASGHAKQVAMDPTETTLTTDRLYPIEELIKGFGSLAAKQKAP